MRTLEAGFTTIRNVGADGGADVALKRAINEGLVPGPRIWTARQTLSTDSGVSNHGDNARQFGYMVEAGMPPMEAILAATRGAADLLGAGDRVGSIQAGRFADIIAMTGDPLKDISELQRVVFVMKGGTIYRGEGKRENGEGTGDK